MPQTIQNDSGEDVVVYTEAELSAQREEAASKVKSEFEPVIKAKEEEIAGLRKVSAEKTENFKKYNELTAEEKKAFDENTTTMMRRADKLEEELGLTKKELADKNERERTYTKDTTLGAFHGGKEDIKKTLEEKYAILSGMPETTPAEIQARATEAAKLAGISVNSVNPLYQGFSGEAPKGKDVNEGDTEKTKEAAELVRQSLNMIAPK